MSFHEIISAHDEKLWTTTETATFLQIPLKTLYQFNHKGTGPKFYVVGKYCRYIPSEVMAWLRNHGTKGFA